MKLRYNIFVLVAVVFATIACTNDPDIIDFRSDVDTIEVDASGGVKRVRISSSDEWVASVRPQADGTANPWITVSPANGRGSVTCDFVIDSAFTTNPRSAIVNITTSRIVSPSIRRATSTNWRLTRRTFR